jgi:universal stress protein A
MMLSSILCPLDFSGVSATLVTYAASLAASSGAALRLVYVLEPHLTLRNAPVSDLWIAAQLAQYHAVAEQAGARTSTGVLTGEPAAEILAEARRWPADAIIIGTHGCTHLTRFLMGSTAEKVVRKASCVTLLVKHCAADVYRQSA